MLRRLWPIFVLCGALAGCGGGSSSGSAGPVPQTPAKTGTAPQSVSVSITIPAPPAAGSSAARRPLYTSVNTHSASVAVDGGAGVISNLSAGAPGCTTNAGGGRTCTIAVTAPIGNHSFSVVLYASTDGSGAPLSQNTTSATIAAGVANVVPITLDGIIASIVVTLTPTNPPVGTPATVAVTVNFKDASGASIVGSDPFVNPVTLTNSDTSGATTLSVNTPLNKPSDAASLTLKYTGAALAQAVIGATASGVAPASVTPATLIPQAVATPAPQALVDWPSYGFDTERSGYNPNTTALTPASISSLHLAWQNTLKSSTQTQPIVITNVAGHAALIVIAQFAKADAYDALTGAQVWERTLPTQDVQDCGVGGISGTASYVQSLSAVFMAAGNGNGAPNHVIVYRLDAATGTITGNVDVTPSLLAGEASYSHSGVTYANGRIYLGTGSDCEGTLTGKFPSWRGRVVSVDPSSMTLLSTFYPTWNQGGAYGGGGVWAWGGVSSDSSGNVFVSTGNGETAGSTGPQAIAPPFAAMPNEFSGYAEHLVKLSSDLGTVEGSNYPGFDFATGQGDLDYTGTPVIYQPSLGSGCGEISATQGKGGTLVVNNATDLSVSNIFKLSVPSSTAYYMGNPGYSPKTGFIYAAITSSGPGSSLLPPGLAAIGGCGTAITWNAQFGPDSTQYRGDNARSAPTVTAGGVVFMGTPCTDDGKGGCGTPGTVNGALWAVDATTGTVLGGGKPLLVTGANIRMAPSADGSWIWLLDGSGNLYGLTVDPSVKAVAARRGQHIVDTLRFHGNR